LRSVSAPGGAAEPTLLTHAGLSLEDLARRPYLLVRLSRAELRRDGAGTVLGHAWWVADPLLQMAVYSLLVSVIFARVQPDYPLFVLAPLLAWKWLATTTMSACAAVTANERLVRQLAFPKIVLPVARVVAELWRFGVALLVLLILMALLWPDRLSLALGWLPLLVLAQLVFMLPIALFGATATVFVRDLPNVARHALRLGLYLSPVLYDVPRMLDRLPPTLGALYALNPLASLMEGYRAVAYHGTAPSATSILIPLGIGLVLLAPALAWFHRQEPRFAKVL
jgi:ABC-type polysaccharide/polyol phosphate export permease